MRRRLASLLLVLSSLLCLTAIMVWITGYREGIITRIGGVDLRLDPGVFGIKRVYEDGPLMTDEDWSKPLRLAQLRTLPHKEYGIWGLTYTLAEERHADELDFIHPRIARYWMVGLPMWLFAVVFALPLLRWIAALPQRRREQRLKNGLCFVCGYDLRASGGRCPECGEVQGEESGKRIAPPLTRSAR